MAKVTLNDTPRANRLHIAVFGRRNAGKSSLVNAITGHNTALVSDTAGTTTDPVYKSMEIHPLGPCVLIDTAGFDDEGELGALRVEKTHKVLSATDVGIVVFTPEQGDGYAQEAEWIAKLKERGVPVLAVVNKADTVKDAMREAQEIGARFDDIPAIAVSALTGQGIGQVRDQLTRLIPQDFEPMSIVGHLVDAGDSVLLVMPQDIQAPKGRLILPQVQTIRDLLDHHCIVTCVTTRELPNALATLTEPPKLIITDSQAFAQVAPLKPEASLLTSFSVLFARYKGDIDAFVRGAAAIDTLTENSRVLIAEACTHAPLTEDIGRVKLPRLLRKKVGEGLTVDMVSGSDFPDDVSGYDLIIHCGACMFNRRYVLSRIEAAKRQSVPITNYGVALAKLTGILDRIETY